MMNKDAITRAEEIIMSKTDCIGGGMEGYNIFFDDGESAEGKLKHEKSRNPDCHRV